MKAIQLLVNSVLPDELKNYEADFSEKGLNKILHAVATKYPERFADVLQDISNIGRKVSYQQGETLTLHDLAPVIDRQAIYDNMEREIAALPRDKDFVNKRREIFQKYNTFIEKETSKNALENRNNIAISVLSGARGKSAQLKAMISTPGTFSDYKGTPIDVFSKESFSDGIRPVTFLASTYGARSSVISTKCLDYQSLVKMADLSEKKLCDIKVGDMVLGADKEGKVFPVKVLNVFDQGEKECYKYTFRYSNSKIALNDVHVTCTEDHKFLVISSREYNRKRSLHKRGNGPAPTWEDHHNKEIHPASKFKRASRASNYNPLLPQGGLFGTKNEPWARMLGLLIGDGCLVGKQVRCAFSCADLQLIEEITPELTALGQKIKKANSDNFTWYITKADYNPIQNNSIIKGVQGFVAGSLMDRNQMLKDYGLLKHYAWEKRFPLGWQSWDEESMKNLIAGLFASDGSVFSTMVGRKARTQVSISFGMTSEDCLKDLHQALMYGFGISSRFENPAIAGGFSSSTKERVHPLYTLEISRAKDVIKFCEIFSDYVPGVKRAKLIEETSKIVIKDHNPYAKAMFLEKEYVGKVHCMDIEVDHPDHLFVLANGLITSNSSTAKGGDLAKQMAQSVVDMVVRKHDCGSTNGISLDIEDESLKGRVLANPVGGFKEGQFITRQMIHELKKQGINNVIARSPLTCNVSNGLCATCVGKFYSGGKLPKIGDALGAAASTAISEPVTQMALSAKHTAGMTQSKKTYSGLGTITQFTQSPEKFKDKATVSELDGTVEDVHEAPQGGHYVVVSGKQHYVPAGHDVEVKPGDTVEAGDFLSEGLGDPEDIIRHKGLGAGRLYYANRLNQILADSGAKNDKRSTEILARGALRHVRIIDDTGYGQYLPDDIVDYNTLQSQYKMPETARLQNAKDSAGKYLQQPVLHYTIGTKITPKVIKDLTDNNLNEIYVDDNEPAFKPEMIRIRAASHTNPDWMASLGTSYLTKQLNESSTKGDDTNVLQNADYRPRLAFGKDFGKNIKQTGLF